MSARKIKAQGAYVIKAAESRPPRPRTTTSSTNGRGASQPSSTDRELARALRQQKQR
jgi:hypothetical protein